MQCPIVCDYLYLSDLQSGSVPPRLGIVAEEEVGQAVALRSSCGVSYAVVAVTRWEELFVAHRLNVALAA